MVARAREAGVGGMVTIGTRLSRAGEQLALAAAIPGVWCTVGTHPHHAAEEGLPQEQEIVALTEHPSVIGIGEAGLDYFHGDAPREVQAAVFRVQIRAARTAGLPICIHSRDADEDMLAILQEETEEGGAFAFLLHCFSSGRALAEGAVALGGHVSFSGILTFPKSHELRAIAADLPADRLLVETDSPYLAPVPFRGKRNEPSYVAHTARVLGEVRGGGGGGADDGEFLSVVFEGKMKKAVLFREKEPKSFYPLGTSVETPRPQEQKFFASFFQKRRPSFCL